MDKFPDDFNTETLKKIRESKQKTLVNTIRKNFYDSVMKDSRNGLQSSRLEFPETLHRQYRIKLCEELLLKFHKIKVTFDVNDPNFCGSHSLEKTFYGYPDDEFLSEYVSTHKNKNINITVVTIDY